jgi:hypothetical protein
MNVKDKYHNSPSHSIEWGEATWDSTDVSIRNRKDNPTTGRFNQAGSSEVPWEDFKIMIHQSILKKKFTNAQLAQILNDISKVI